MFEPQGSLLMLPSDASKGQTPQGGKVFYVNETSGVGSDSHEGTDPQFPLASITAALVLCTALKGDYIFVQARSGTGYAQVDLNKTHVHLIGLGNGNYTPIVRIVGGNDACGILLGTSSSNAEIAGFEIGSGTDQDEPSIELDGNVVNIHIHHCCFGGAVRAHDGILIPAGFEFGFGLIDHNWFSRRLDGWGINAEAVTANFTSSAILHNMFKMADGEGGVILHAGEPEAISYNTFGIKLGADEGWAITLGIGGGYTCVNAMVHGNHASETGDNTTGNNPYLDRSTGSTTTMTNFWSVNYKGEALITPATA